MIAVIITLLIVLTVVVILTGNIIAIGKDIDYIAEKFADIDNELDDLYDELKTNHIEK